MRSKKVFHLCDARLLALLFALRSALQMVAIQHGSQSMCLCISKMREPCEAKLSPVLLIPFPGILPFCASAIAEVNLQQLFGLCYECGWLLLHSFM